MVTETRMVAALAALIAVAGVATVEMLRGPAQADPAFVAGGAAGYAGSRVDGVFATAAGMPPAADFRMEVARKGDLPPIGCAGPFRASVAAECMDTAYEAASEPSMVVETRSGAASVLARMDGFTMAGF